MTWTDPLLTAFETGDVLTEANVKTYVLDNLYSLPHPLEAPTTAALTVTSTTTETTVYSVTVPANAMGTNGAVRMEMRGQFAHNNAAGDTITLRAKFGGVTFWELTSNLGNANSATANPWWLNIEVFNEGATNAQDAFLEGYVWSAAVAANASSGIGGLITNGFDLAGASTITSMAVDTTANQTLAFTVQWSASAAALQWTRRRAQTLIGKW